MPAIDPVVAAAHTMIQHAYLAAVMLLAHTHTPEARRLAEEHDRFLRVTGQPTGGTTTTPTP